ncbi:MAG: CarD family transcriptional regulator, partial [Cellvibrionales bacterium]
MLTELVATTPWPRQVGTRTALGPMPGAACSHALAQLALAHPLLVVVVPSSSEAATLERELPLFTREPVTTLSLPDWETLPYDTFSPHQDIVSQRLSTFHQLPELSAGILIVPVTTLMQRCPPVHYIAGSSLMLDVGQPLDTQTLVHNLSLNGYRSVDTVYEHGEFAVRGSLLDIFPMGSSLPYRIDLFDDEIESLRTFDPETQRTIAKVDSIRLLPAREFPLTSDAIERFKLNWYRSFDGDPENCSMFREICQGRVPGGAEYFLPLFFEACGTVFDYLPADAPIITVGDHYGAASQFWGEVTARFEEYGIDPRRPLLPPARLFLPVEELYAALRQTSVLELRNEADAPVHQRTDFLPPPQLHETTEGSTALGRLERFIAQHEGPVLICAETAGRREILLEGLHEIGLAPQEVSGWPAFIAAGCNLAITVAPVDRGLFSGSTRATLVCENQIFGERVAQRRRRRRNEETNTEAIVRDLTELRVGMPVVHLQHGVGRYLGLQTLTIEDEPAEFLLLEYAEEDKLYVPVGSLHLIARYTGADPDSAPLHRLGSEQWEKARRRAREKANDVAAQLLEVYARREARVGFQCQLDETAWLQFSEGFPFEETPDQVAAIEAVREDMCTPRVMDRLICGDVGFGKTEVAMRAAFIAIQNQKQVVVLVPTTLLAQQHYNSFKDRFAGWPVRIDVVSRFKSSADLSTVQGR